MTAYPLSEDSGSVESVPWKPSLRWRCGYGLNNMESSGVGVWFNGDKCMMDSITNFIHFGLQRIHELM